jgi:hypothetical protein
MLTDDGVYIEPKEHVVGTRQESKVSNSAGFPTSSIVEDKMYYVPLDSLFSVIFKSQRVLGLVKKPVEIENGHNVI